MKIGSKSLQTGSLVLAALVLSGMVWTACDLNDQEVAVHVSSYENLCGEIAEVMCSNMFQCCSEAEIQQSMNVLTDVSERDCHRDKMLYCEERLSTVIFALENGTSSLNVNAINNCLNALLAPSNTCVDVELEPAWREACNDVDFFEGNQETNELCYWDFECSLDSYCSSNQSCKDLPTLNEDCSTLPCASGYYCGPDLTYNMVCQEYQQLEENCSTDPSDGMMCDPETMYCEDWNTSDSSFDGWCLAKKGLGVACTGDHQCESAECAPGYCEGYEDDLCYEDDDCWMYGASCLGEIVCVGNPEISNYCTLGLNVLGFFPNPNYYY